ncbi:MAG: hypothetical protein K2H70_04490 [Bacteroidales bacterium]|nr:hypothetical protein [Bacteroidales bacterium]
MDKQAVPYRLGDTVRFVDGQGNPVTLQVVRFEDGWAFHDESEAYYHFVYYEYRHVKLRSQDGAFNVAVRVQKDDIRHYPDISSRIDIYLGEPSQWLLSMPVGDWHDSVAIGGRMYYNVVGTQYYSYRCYYNKTEGILQLKTNDVFIERLP